MPFCSFAEGAGMYDVTPVENMFLLEYLPTAPGDFLRVYLYARMLSLHPELGDGMADVARALNMDEDAVFNAMTYWERQGLVRRMTDRPPTYALLPFRGNAPAANPMDADYYQYRDFNASLQALFGPDTLLHPKQYEMANDWLNLLGFTQDAVLRMVEARLKKSRSKKPDPVKLFSRLNEIAAEWSERGVRTAEDVERALEYDSRVEKTASAVIKQFSMRRPATVDELQLVSKWLNEWGMSPEQILAACAETTKSRNPSLKYLDSILESRRKGEDANFGELKAVLRELGAEDRPTPDQLKNYGKMLDQGFEPETIRLAAVQCARKKKHRFEELEWMVGKWGEQQLYRFADADAYVRSMNRMTDEVRALLAKCGADRRPQMEDLTMYERWTAESPRPLIDYAAECAKGMQLPMRYMDKLLGEWQKAGVTTVDAARAEHERHSAAAKTVAQAVNPALDYEQRANADGDYDGLFINLDAENGGEGA